MSQDISTKSYVIVGLRVSTVAPLLDTGLQESGILCLRI